MKLPARAFRALWELHAWVGATISLVLFVLCWCGIFALYRHEIAVWQEPARHLAPAPDRRVDWDALVAHAAGERPPLGSSVGFQLRDSRVIDVSVWAEGERRWLYDPDTGAVHPITSRLAEELHGLHFLERLPLGEPLSGFVAFAFFAVTVTGLCVQLKDLVPQLWRFRPEGKRRFVASDAHKVLGVFGLPFAVVFGWSGALLGWFDLQTRLFAALAHDGDTAAVEDLRGYAAPARPPTGRPADPLAPAAIVAAGARAVEAAGEPAYVDLFLLGDEAAWASLFWDTEGLAPRAWARLDAVTGEVLATAATDRTPSNDLDKVLFDLHYGRFGGRVVQACYAALTVALAAVIVTGNLVWLERRDPRRERPGNRLLERATAGVAGGLVLGCAAAFAANRAVPAATPGHAQIELAALYGGWLVAAAAAFAPAVSVRRWLGAALALAGALYLAAALLGLRLPTNLLAPSGPAAVVVVDLLLLALAAGCLAAAAALRRPRREGAP